jgi:hypothetical protein
VEASLEMPLKARVYAGAVIGLGVFVLSYSLFRWEPHDVLRFLCYLALALPASCLKVSLPGVTGTMSVLFVFLLAGTVELDLPETLVIGALCVIMQSFWLATSKPRAVQVAFSVATIVLAVAATHYVYDVSAFLPASFRLGRCLGVVSL